MRKEMLVYVVKRLIMCFITVVVVITATFFLMNAVPGGPFLSEKAASQQILDALNAKYGLDQPLIVQYWNYLKGALIFDFGPSLKQKGFDVIDIINDGFKTSLPIGLIAGILALAFGTFLGSLAAVKHNKVADRIIMIFSTASVAFPSFIIASVLLYVFCTALGWLPANGITTNGDYRGYILPIVTLSLYPTAYITRLTRSSTLDVLNSDYIRTAKAKGVSKNKILFKHALRNSLTPVITYAGPMFASIITGSLVVEQIYSIPGLGRIFIKSITGRDYPLIMGSTIFLTVIVILLILVCDILYKVANPRVELE
jgi:ABC-type dipeptide/oligopeptide/nickel transport systems, permease components